MPVNHLIQIFLASILMLFAYTSSGFNNQSAQTGNDLHNDQPDKTYDPFREFDPQFIPLDEILDNFFNNEHRFFNTHFHFKNYSRLTLSLDENPFPILGFDLDTSRKGMFLLEESFSHLSGSKANGYKEKVLATRVSGDDRGVSRNYRVNQPVNLYNRLLHYPDFIERGIVSPAGRSAKFYYHFEHEATFEKDGHTIFSIKVTPRRRHDPAFEGYIYIEAENFLLTGAELKAKNPAQNGYIDELFFEQWYIYTEYDMWAPDIQEISFSSKRSGFKFNGSLYNKFSGFNRISNEEQLAAENEKPNTQKHDDHTFISHFSEETNDFFKKYDVVVDQESVRKPYEYWNTTRPFSLSPEEKADYEWRDSLYFLYNRKSFSDSVDKAHNKFTAGKLLFRGYRWQNSKNQQYIDFKPLLTSIQYNTVEGINPGVFLHYTQHSKNSPEFNLSGGIRYGSALRRLYTHWEIEQGNWFISTGKNAQQLNNREPISQSVNSLYTLIDGNNLMKLYEDTWLSSRYTYNAYQKLKPSIKLSFSQRDTLVNNSYPFYMNENRFTPNMPVEFIEHDEQNAVHYRFSRHEAFTAEINFEWLPFKRTALYPGQKEVTISDGTPIFNLTYRKGIPWLLNSVADYDFIKASASHTVSAGLAGKSTIFVQGGGFLSNRVVPFMDQHHFMGNQTIFRQNAPDGFQLLDYYSHSTRNQFAQLHLTHHFNGFIMNKIPGARNLQASFVAGIDILHLPENDFLHQEFSVGLEKILGVFRIDYVTAFRSNGIKDHGFRLGLQKPFPGFELR